MNQIRTAIVMAACLSAVMLPVPSSAQSTRSPVVVFSGSRSFLGVGVADVNAEKARTLKLKEEYGVEITRVEEDSPAAKAGLKVNDVVIEYQGQRVEGTEQFVRLVRETPAGRDVKMLVNRGGQSMTLTASIAARKMRTVEAGDRQIVIPHIEIPEIKIPSIGRLGMYSTGQVLGIEAESLSSQLADFFGVKDGVLVRSVAKGSAAEKAALKAGDVITKVDDTKVTSPMEVTRALRTRDGDQKRVLTVTREKRETTITVTIEDSRPAVRGRAIRAQEFEF